MNTIHELPVEISADRTTLRGDLVLPEEPRGIVVFAHGSGSSRRSPRNRMVAGRLNAVGFATLLFDLLDELESEIRARVFDIPLLAQRLLGATAWCETHPSLAGLPVGYFGASTGAAAALVAETRAGHPVAAIVSRGGRPDLAADALPNVRAPTLLIVGSWDEQVLELNRMAYERMRCPRQLDVVPGATHLFEEPGTLESVADSATAWFKRHLGALVTTAGAPRATGHE